MGAAITFRTTNGTSVLRNVAAIEYCDPRDGELHLHAAQSQALPSLEAGRYVSLPVGHAEQTVVREVVRGVNPRSDKGSAPVFVRIYSELTPCGNAAEGCENFLTGPYSETPNIRILYTWVYGDSGEWRARIETLNNLGWARREN